MIFVLVVAMCALSSAVNTVIVLEHQGSITATQVRLEVENAARKELEMCLTTWANATTDRTAALFAASQARQHALDGLIGAVAASSQTRFKRALNRYEVVVQRFNALAKEHPIPPAPRFLCDQ